MFTKCAARVAWGAPNTGSLPLSVYPKNDCFCCPGSVNTVNVAWAEHAPKSNQLKGKNSTRSSMQRSLQKVHESPCYVAPLPGCGSLQCALATVCLPHCSVCHSSSSAFPIEQNIRMSGGSRTISAMTAMCRVHSMLADLTARHVLAQHDDPDP